MRRHHVHVVLDHQHGAVGGDLLDQLRHAVPRLRGPCPAWARRAASAWGPWPAWWRSRARACGRRATPPSPRRRTRAGPRCRAAPARVRSARSSTRSAAPEVVRQRPAWRCSAMRTFSQHLRCGKVAEIWNERTMPRRAICAGFSCVMSWPLKRICPRVGIRNLVSRLKQVVLPAPLGPISAWISPRRTRRLTPSTATNPLNSLTSPRVSRTRSPDIPVRVAPAHIGVNASVHYSVAAGCDDPGFVPSENRVSAP